MKSHLQLNKFCVLKSNLLNIKFSKSENELVIIENEKMKLLFMSTPTFKSKIKKNHGNKILKSKHTPDYLRIFQQIVK